MSKYHIVRTTNRTSYIVEGIIGDPLKETTLVLKKARCLIWWGTKGTLAQLASSGMTDETVLGDPTEDLVVHSVFEVYTVKDDSIGDAFFAAPLNRK